MINFAVIGHLTLLHQLFGQLTIRQAVAHELERRQQRYPDVFEIVRQSGSVDVLAVQHTVLRDVLLFDLDPGEAEAIALAVEHRAELVILDEVAGRYAAEAQGLLFTGLITNIRPSLDAMRQQANFWLRDPLYERVLRDAGE